MARPPIRSRLRGFHSVLEELACLIWRACDSQDDVRTIADWAHAVGKGYSSLRALSDCAGVEPHAAKDLARCCESSRRPMGKWRRFRPTCAMATAGRSACYYVTSGYDKLAFALVVGPHPWDSGLSTDDAGEVYENEIGGAVVNLAVDGVYGGAVYDNSLSSAQGSAGYNCSVSADFTLGHYSGIYPLQGGSTSLVYDGGSCYVP